MSGEVFGTGGGKDAAKLMGVDFLATIELDPRIRIGGDEGKPIVIDAPDSPGAIAFRQLARVVAALISVATFVPEPEVRII
jgi:ATP-binding protein involved in chromosome partitioning